MNKGMNTMQRPVRTAAPKVTIRRLPASGNTALAASALIQAALGIEFLLSGLNKFADPNFVRNFQAFVDASPGTRNGLLAGLIHTLVQPNIAFFASLTKYTELALGIVLLLGALEVGRRRLSGRVGVEHGYEAPIPVELLLVPLGIAVAWMEAGRFRVLHRAH